MRGNLLAALVLMIAPLLSGAALAQTHAAHEHGAAALNLVIEDSGFELELHGALAGFLSFESEPATDAQKAEVREMAEKLGRAGDLFKAPAAAGCQVESIELSSENLPAELLAPHAAAPGSGHHHEGEEDDHDHEGEEDDHDHEEGDHDHADLDADYEFKCSAPQALDSLTVGLFEVFPGLEEIEVQMVTPKGQSAAELTASSAVLKW